MQLAQDRDERVVRRVHREVVEVARTVAADAGGALTASDLEAGGAQQQRVQALDRGFARGPCVGERLKPVA